MLLKDKIAVVTGGARGIGKDIALCLAREGANLAICDINAELLAKVSGEIKSLGREVLCFEVNVADSAQVEEMVNKTLDKFGRIDILINNAGITRDSLLVRLKESDWDAVLDVNLKGTFNYTKAVAKVMLKERSGKIVNIASIIGIIGNAGQANYAASKAGIIGFTKSVARELASRGINVNAVAPGFIQTEMTAKLPEEAKEKLARQIPLGTLGTVSDVTQAVLFLVTENSRYITGQVIRVDGGMVM